MAETLKQIEGGVRHVLETHPDHRALLLMLARRFGVTVQELQDEVIAECKNIPRR